MRRWLLSHGALALVACGCQSATEITIEITTDVDCNDVKGTMITVGRLGGEGGIEDRAPASAVPPQCKDGRIGSMVIVPSGAHDEAIAFKIVTGYRRPVDQCGATDAGDGCIVVRRALTFLNHESLRVPVVMRASCNGIACDPSLTCVRGHCLPATIDPAACKGSGCPEPALYPDAGPPLDGGTEDAGPPPSPVCDTTGLQVGAPWPMAGECPARRGRAAVNGPQARPRVKWAKPYAARVGLSVVVGADGAVYASTASGIVAIEPSDGSQRWAFTTSTAPAVSPILTADDTVYTASDGNLYAIDLLGNGRLGWPVATHAPPTAGLGRTSNGSILLADNSATIQAVAPQTKTQDWMLQIAGGTDSSFPAVATSGAIFFAANGGNVYSLDAAGRKAWVTPLPGVGTDTVVIAPDGSLRLQADPAGKLYALDGTGHKLWEATTGAEPNDLAVADDGSTYLYLDDQQLHSYDASGAPGWTFPRTGFNTPSIGADGTIYAVAQGVVYALDPKGNELWELPIGPSTLVVKHEASIGLGQTLYFAADDGKVYAIGP